MAFGPNKEVLQNVQAGKDDELSTCFKNMTDAAFEYAMTNETQQLETTKGTMLVNKKSQIFYKNGELKKKYKFLQRRPSRFMTLGFFFYGCSHS
jgi:hypothetical protein